MGMPVPSVVAITPVVVIPIVTPITLVVTPPVVGPVTFLVATPTVVATTPSARALQRNQDRGGDDGTPYPLHGFHRFTPTRRTGRHDPRSRTGRTPREGEAGDGPSPDEPKDLGNCLSRRGIKREWMLNAGAERVDIKAPQGHECIVPPNLHPHRAGVDGKWCG